MHAGTIQTEAAGGPPFGNMIQLLLQPQRESLEDPTETGTEWNAGAAADVSDFGEGPATASNPTPGLSGAINLSRAANTPPASPAKIASALIRFMLGQPGRVGFAAGSKDPAAAAQTPADVASQGPGGEVRKRRAAPAAALQETLKETMALASFPASPAPPPTGDKNQSASDFAGLVTASENGGTNQGRTLPESTANPGIEGSLAFSIRLAPGAVKPSDSPGILNDQSQPNSSSSPGASDSESGSSPDPSNTPDRIAASGNPPGVLTFMGGTAGKDTAEKAIAEPSPAPDARSIYMAEPAATPLDPTPASNVASNGIVVRVAREDATLVDVQVKQVSGQVQVAVRTADPALQSSLRQELPALVSSLERAGYRTETFTPAAAAQSSDGAGTGQNQSGAQAGFSNTFGNRGGGDSAAFSGGSPGREGQANSQPRGRLAQHWLEQMEE